MLQQVHILKAKINQARSVSEAERQEPPPVFSTAVMKDCNQHSLEPKPPLWQSPLLRSVLLAQVLSLLLCVMGEILQMQLHTSYMYLSPSQALVSCCSAHPFTRFLVPSSKVLTLES